MGTDRRKQLLLAVLVIALGVVAYRALVTSPAPSASSNPARTGGPGGRGARSNGITAPDVHLNALNGERPKPVGPERNLFRFREKPAPAPPPVARGTGPVEAPPATSGPPQPPPITLKFIGTVQANGGR